MRACRRRSTSGTSHPSGVSIRKTRADVTVRDFNIEYQASGRKYAYDFDGVVRRYMMRTFAPHFPPGRALELGCYTGEVTELIADVYSDLTVVEASSELAAVASRRLGGRATFVTATIETAALQGG